MQACLIFPHQLFRDHPGLSANRSIYLVEHELLFTQFSFHKHKLVLHRASMQAYHDLLIDRGFQVQYISFSDPASSSCGLVAKLLADQVSEVYLADPTDDWLYKQTKTQLHNNGILLHLLDSPGFMLTSNEVLAYPVSHSSNLHASFYKHMRKKWQILTDSKGNPAGGQWSFDADNRKRYPAGKKAPGFIKFGVNTYVKEACDYVNRYFPDNPGHTDDFFYPVTHSEAQEWLTDFLENRFREFGPYEDAIQQHDLLLHHSLLSPLLNIGLLEPLPTVKTVLSFSEKDKTELATTEGFIRQVIGWREYIRLMYERTGSKQRTRNYWGFNRKLSEPFWKGKTGLVPFDQTMKKILDTGYCHHIERLMVLGSLMLMLETDPDEVYAWFMTFFIDAYDWVMVPNVYGMSQYADGGLMCTKPYISGSNYLLKMSDFPKGRWQDTWDALFWHFMHSHRSFFQQNPRMGMLIRTLDKMPEDKRNQLFNAALQWKEQ